MFPLFRDQSSLDGAAAASSSSAPRTIREGDLVIVYESPQSMKAVTIDGGKGQFQNRFGNFPHKVGAVASSCKPSCMGPMYVHAVWSCLRGSPSIAHAHLALPPSSPCDAALTSSPPCSPPGVGGPDVRGQGVWARWQGLGHSSGPLR